LAASYSEVAMYVAIEGAIVGGKYSFFEGMMAMFAGFYVFNMKYPPEMAVALEFIQR
jgi:hypothetical protein